MNPIQPVLSSLGAKIFAQTGSCLLRIGGWKRRTVEANLKQVYGDGDIHGTPQKGFYRQLIRNLARHVSDILFKFNTYKELPREIDSYPCRMGKSSYGIAEGSERALRKMRQGGIFLTAHYGNYEAMGPWLCRLGIPLKASYIPLKPAWLNSFVEEKLRSVGGASYAVNPKSPREFLRIIEEGNLFCLLADQDSRIPSAREGTLLGQRVHVNPLPDFLLRHHQGTPVFVCWIDEAPRRRVLHAEELQAGNEGIMEAFNRWLEKRIEENPALWYGWTHRRFYSTAPEIYG